MEGWNPIRLILQVVNPTQNWFWELVLYHLDIPNEA